MPIRIQQTPAPLSLEARKTRTLSRGEAGTTQSSEMLARSMHLISAKSEASRILEWELARYCNGQIQGRSFLIAGHRGSGKTSMVNDVIEFMLRQSLLGKLALRPLFVPLHGPSLFDVANEDEKEKEKEGESTASKATAKGTNDATPDASGSTERPDRVASAKNDEREKATRAQARNALMQIILGLHRAVVKEYADAYYKSAEQYASPPSPFPLPLPPTPGPAAAPAPAPSPTQPLAPDGRLTGPDCREWAELAAQFEVELAEDPRASRLRQFYAYIGALERGILNCNVPARGDQARTDQGARELVALNGICTAHQRISGKLSEQENSSQNESQMRQMQSGLSLADTDTLKQIAVLASGAAVTGGAAAGPHPLWQSALLGAATVLVASLALKYSSTSTYTSERSVDRVFIPDLSLRTLDRVLPTLLERLINAGLAPVLVIDELDKVRGLSGQLGDMVNHLKKLLAENAFSCFLTDRAYLEYRELDERRIAYGPAYSYFSHSLLVTYEPADLDRYLDRLLYGAVEQGEQIDREVLKWVLRHRSAMHAMALHREIAALSKQEDESELQRDPVIALPRGAVRSKQAYRIDATMQVAIEYHLNTRQVVGWLTQYPHKRQTLIDALYFISRQWRNGKGSLDLSDACKDIFRTELERRMNLDEVLTPNEWASCADASSCQYSLSEDDIGILFGVARDLALDLSNNGVNRFKREQWQQDSTAPSDSRVPIPGQEVLDAMLMDLRSILIVHPPTVPIPNAPAPASGLAGTEPVRVYRFRYWPSGEERDWAELDRLTASSGALRAPEVLAVQKTASELADEAIPRIAYMNDFERALWPMFSNEPVPKETDGSVFLLLSDQLRVLPTTPAWSQVQAAKDRLGRARYGQGSVKQLIEDLGSLSEFETNITASVDVLEIVLPVAAFLGALGANPDTVSAIRHGLDVLASGLKFAQTDPGGIRRAVVELVSELNGQFSDKALLVLPLAASESGNATLRRLPDFKSLADSFYSRAIGVLVPWSSVVMKAWDDFLKRIAGPATIESEFSAYFEEILCAAGKCGPASVMGLDIAALSLRGWTRALIAASHSAADYADTYVPESVIALALQNLGLNNVRRVFALSLQDAIMKSRKGQTQPKAPPTPQPSGLLSSSESTRAWIAVVIVDSGPGKSASNGWTISPTQGLCFAIEPAEMNHLTNWLNEIPFTLPEPIKIVWEKDPGETSRFSFSNSWQSATKTAVLESVDLGLLAQLPLISSPEFPDELIARLFAPNLRGQP